jgi:hypothetical protein
MQDDLTIDSSVKEKSIEDIKKNTFRQSHCDNLVLISN